MLNILEITNKMKVTLGFKNMQYFNITKTKINLGFIQQSHRSLSFFNYNFFGDYQLHGNNIVKLRNNNLTINFFCKKSSTFPIDLRQTM